MNLKEFIEFENDKIESLKVQLLGCSIEDLPRIQGEIKGKSDILNDLKDLDKLK